MSDLLTFVILAFVTYRVTRLAILDSIFDAPRDWLHAWLLNGNEPAWWNGKWWNGPLIGFIAAIPVFVGVMVLYENGPRWVGVLCFITAALWLLLGWLASWEGPTWLGHKIEEMISCPYCLSVWAGLGAQLIAWTVTSIPLPGLYFLALSGAGMVIYQYIDFEPEESKR